MKTTPLTTKLIGGLFIASALLTPVAAADKLVIATVNNGDMVRMQTLTDDFTKKAPRHRTRMGHP